MGKSVRCCRTNRYVTKADCEAGSFPECDRPADGLCSLHRHFTGQDVDLAKRLRVEKKAAVAATKPKKERIMSERTCAACCRDGVKVVAHELCARCYGIASRKGWIKKDAEDRVQLIRGELDAREDAGMHGSSDEPQEPTQATQPERPTVEPSKLGKEPQGAASGFVDGKLVIDGLTLTLVSPRREHIGEATVSMRSENLAISAAAVKRYDLTRFTHVRVFVGDRIIGLEFLEGPGDDSLALVKQSAESESRVLGARSIQKRITFWKAKTKIPLEKTSQGNVFLARVAA